MKLSVIICTRNRPDTVGQALESVAECEFSPFDVHVMDQSTDTLTRDIVLEQAKRFEHKLKINYHHLEKAGLSRAYNAGIAASDGEIVACTDDDVVVPKDWLEQIHRAFAADPGAGLLYGQVLVPESLKDAGEDIVVPNLLIKRHERLAKGKGFKVFGMGANYALRRSVALKIGGFDEALGGGGPLRSSQDFDFAYRTYLSGAAIILVPEVKVDHYGTRTTEQWPATLKAYGIGDGAFYSKHIRCGDPYALWLFTKLLARAGARQVKSLVLKRTLRPDEYALNLFNGIRDAAKFDIERPLRIYRENARAQMTVTEANAVTGAQRARD